MKLDFSSYHKSKNKQTAIKKYCDYLLDLDKDYESRHKNFYGSFKANSIRYKISTYTSELVLMLVEEKDMENLEFVIKQGCCTVPEVLIVVAAHGRIGGSLLEVSKSLLISDYIKQNLDLFKQEAKDQRLPRYDEFLEHFERECYDKKVDDMTEKLKDMGLTKDMLKKMLDEGKI